MTRRGETASRATLTVNAGPLCVGKEERIRLSTGENAVRVGGNRPVWPRFELSLTGYSKAVRVLDYAGRFVEFTSSSTMTGSAVFDLDPMKRVTRINSNHRAMTLASTPFALNPGMNQLMVSGASGTLSYRPAYYL
ncbi:hypothetical protein G7Y41_07115 [Schaalia sp. ZJ405]|uniref:phage distal tail protein n=1 Tax=Schaalia sp. ZJ405 TaxID=2709403 RepID=UPI0018CA065D|nr:hypothetical protein [Schaalia sp. ZJ405]QPK80823.1 hypothetical protein G7Y41_07115 [Schaalia sp. ZJ405]